MQLSTTVQGRFGGAWSLAYWALVALMLGFLASTRFIRLEGLGTNVIFTALSLGMLLVALFMRRQRALDRALTVVAMGVLVVVSVYFYLERINLLERSPLARTDVVLGMAFLLMVLWLVQRTFGWVFPIIAIIAVAYAFAAPHLPEPFTSPAYAPRVVFDRLTKNIYVGLLNLMWQFLWLLLFWGTLLNVSGFGRVIMRLGRALARRMRGGPAFMSLVTSTAAGSFTGVGATNCAVTGPVTIPLMKRGGYTPAQAGAIEALASNVAGLVPPILGTAAFLMVEFLRISYARIMLISLVPALMWFLTVGAFLFAHANRYKEYLRPVAATAQDDEIAGWQMVRATIVGVVPLAVLVVLAARGWHLYNVVPWAFLTLVALAVLLRSETRWSEWSRGIKDGALLASLVTGVLILLEVLNQALTVSGLNVKMGDVIWELSSGNIVIASVVMLAAGVVLGSALPTVAVYVIMAVTFVPALLRFGIPPISSHFVAFYMGLLGTIVPPVASSAVITAAIAGSTYWQVCWQLMRMALPVMIAPVAFLVAPELLLAGGMSEAATVLNILAFLVASATLSFATAGWLVRELAWPARAVLVASYVVFYTGLLANNELLVALTFVGPVAVAGWNAVRARTAPATPTGVR